MRAEVIPNEWGRSGLPNLNPRRRVWWPHGPEGAVSTARFVYATNLHCPATPHQQELLAQWARRYIRWKSVDDAMLFPERIIAQVMNIGDYKDVQALVEAFGDGALREVIQHAEIGMFNARSWHFAF